MEGGGDGGGGDGGAKSGEIMKAGAGEVEREMRSRVGRITGNELYYAPFTCKREKETAVIPKRRDK